MSSRVLVGLAVVFLGLALGFLVGWAVGAACPVPAVCLLVPFFARVDWRVLLCLILPLYC